MPTDHEVEIALLKQEVEGLNTKLDTLSADVRELVDAWKAAGTMVGFVKTVAAIVVAVSVIIGTLKFGVTPGDAK